MSETLTGESQVKTYRGDSIEALLPRIRAELGPEATILRQREGLVGGVGGFFQKRCIEIEAQPGGPGIDVYDDGAPAGPAQDDGDFEPLVRNDAATREGLATTAVRELVDQAQPFAEMLGEMADEPEAAPERPEPRRAATLRDGLLAAGLGADLAGEIVDAVVASALPFASPGRLRTLVRDELALRLPVAPAAAPGRRVLALVGPAGAGKTAALAAIAAAHASAGTEVVCLALDPSDGGGALTGMLAGTGVAATAVSAAELGAAATGPELVLIDTPPAWPGSDGIGALAGALAAAAPDEVHLALRAGTAAGAGAELASGLEALCPSRLLLTAAAETAHLGGALDVAIRASLPLGYVAEGPGQVAPADARDLASRITP
jgi:flagellar biosynthesis protein FlhF